MLDLLCDIFYKSTDYEIQKFITEFELHKSILYFIKTFIKVYDNKIIKTRGVHVCNKWSI